ncbi:ABC transporter substrate-binding protein [Halostagnicola sp. A-GB9-2]|uniref:ABC transporter substrate-binding protein n=1 Tax=Halostagnicola sp. A-GB9-2 TaxID=3048066 RepID=UPI0024C09379|nr:ABC transporter substrate-binding protein [Halostagnicola sp. A-GB9-2]MDJ1434633.1 ABC transporter substrate-binding protein [Halostagnicola sp. A-GB9-2]
MGEDHIDRDYCELVSRRSFIAATGVAGSAALAGCYGSGDDGNWFNTAQVEHEVGQYQYNPHEWGGFTHASFGLFDEYAQYLVGEDEFYPHFVEEWETDEGEMTLHLRDDYTWGNGDDITADDIVMQLEIGEALDSNLWEFADDVEATDDHTVVISYSEGTNTDIIEHTVLNESLDHPPADWVEIHEAIQNGDDVDIFGHEIEEPTPSGPIELSNTTDSYHEYTIRDDHPLADNYDWEGYRMEYRSENQAAHQSFQQQDLDGIHSLFADPEIMDTFPDSLEEIQIPGGFGFGVAFNYDDEHYGDREVRQAFMHALDRDLVIENIGESTSIKHDAPTGLTAVANDEWFGDPTDQYEPYEHDLDRVEELLESAGYERNGDDIWERDGEVLEANIIVASSWSDWVTMASTCADQLSQAGFDSSADTRGEGAWYELMADGDFQVTAYGHTQGGDPAMNHPFFALRWKLLNREHDSDSSFYNYPEEVTVPEMDGDGEMTVDFNEEFEALAATNDEAEMQEIVERLAWVVNQDVPLAIIQEKYEQTFIDREMWDIPDESEHFQSYWPLWWLPKVDDMSAAQ